MGHFESIKAAIDAKVNTNGRQAITGHILNNILHGMLDSIDVALADEVKKILGDVSLDYDTLKEIADYIAIDKEQYEKMLQSLDELYKNVGGDLNSALREVDKAVQNVNETLSATSASLNKAIEDQNAEYTKEFADTKEEINETLNVQTEQYTKEFAAFTTQYNKDYASQKKAIDDKIEGQEEAIYAMVDNQLKSKADKAETDEKLTKLEYYAGVQSDLNVTFEDKADGSIDVVFNKRVIFIKNGHKGFNLTFDSYPQTFNVPRYYTLAVNVETREVALQNVGDGIEVQNNLILLHNEPKGVFNGVFAMLYNTTKTNTTLNDFIQYKDIDQGGSVISPYSSISIRKGDDSNLIVKFSAAKYNIINDYGSNPNFTIDAGTELIVPNYGAIFADIASRKIILSDGYYTRASKQILLAYNEGGVILSGLLKGLYDKTFNDAPALIKTERDFVDITYSQKINNAWVSATNVENRHDTNFDLYYYSIDSHTSKVQLYNATGGGHTIFLDADGNVLLTHQSSPQYQSAWYEYDVPQGTTMIKVTHAKWQEKYPYAFPLRVRANHQAYTNDNLLNLTGKKVVFFGDSITEMGYYVNAFQKMTGCNVVKRGASGTSFTKTTGRGYEDSLSERIDLPSSDAVGNKLGLPSEADLVIVLAGVNDWGQRNNWDIDLGSMTAAIDKTNFTGAVKYVFSKLREKYPTTPIVVLSMLHVYHPTSFGTWREITYSDGQYGGEITYLTDKDGNTMDVWRKRVGEVANFYGIPFVNMTQCGFTPFLQSDNETFMPDGLHPSEEGGEIMAKYIIAQIKSLIS